MTLNTIALVAALVASIYLVLQKRARPYALGAAIVSGIALAISAGILSLRVPYLALGLSGALLVLGVLLVLRVADKMRIVASTIIAVIGAVGVLGALL